MSLSNWYRRLRFQQGRRWMISRKTWGENDETIEYLFENLGRVDWKRIDARSLETTTGRFWSPTVDRLILGLQTVSHSYLKGEPVRELIWGDQPQRILTIDDFLVSERGYSVDPATAVGKLKAVLLPLIDDLRTLQSLEDTREGHYRRTVALAWSDVFELLEKLADLAGL